MGCGSSTAAQVSQSSPRQQQQELPKPAGGETNIVVVGSAHDEPKVAARPIPSSLLPLAGKVAIVTGASRGIGAATAVRLAADGAKVIVNYNSNEQSATKVVNLIKTSPHASATAIRADVSKSTEVNKLFEAAIRLYGRIDIVVANAGVFRANTISSTSNEEFDLLIDNNVKSVFYTLRAAANHIENNGRIIVIGSVSKTGVLPGYAPYAASKAAIEVLANTLAQELGSKAVTVNTLHPGPVDTDMLAPVLNSSDAARNMFTGLSPMKRIATPQDVADAISLFAREQSRWISGQNVAVSGAAKL